MELSRPGYIATNQPDVGVWNGSTLTAFLPLLEKHIWSDLKTANALREFLAHINHNYDLRGDFDQHGFKTLFDFLSPPPESTSTDLLEFVVETTRSFFQNHSINVPVTLDLVVEPILRTIYAQVRWHLVAATQTPLGSICPVLCGSCVSSLFDECAWRVDWKQCTPAVTTQC